MAKHFTNLISRRWLSRSPASGNLKFKKKKNKKLGRSVEVEAPRGLRRQRRSSSPRLRSCTTKRPPPDAPAMSRRRRREGEFQYCCDCPEEIVREILVRLPSVKSIIKCTAVCKSWRYVIESPTFIAAHLSLSHRRHHQNHDDLFVLKRRLPYADLLLYRDDAAGACASPPGGFRSAEGHGEYCASSLTNNTNSMIITPFTCKSTYEPVGTCNGIICLANFDHPKIIWNPLVRKFVRLPSCGAITIPEGLGGDDGMFPTCAFGYDSRNNDYKVLRIWSNYDAGGPAGDTPFGVEVYSLARGSWKTLPSSATSFPGCFDLSQQFPRRRHVYVNGVVHWLLPRDRKKRRQVVIVSFDMVTETFSEIELPKQPGSPPYFGLSVHEEDGSSCLALIEYDDIDCQPARSNYHLCLWVMQQYGAVDSWTKLYSVTMNDPKINRIPCPFAFKSNGQQVFRSSANGTTWDAQLLTVDFKTKQVQFIGQDGCFHESMHSFVESLVLLDQSNAFSY